MKRGLLGFPLLIFLIQAVSAQFFGGYGGFSLRGFFDAIDPQTFILSLLFLILFALIFYPLSRFFKDPYGEPHRAIPGTIAFCGSAIIIYFLYRSGFNIEDLFYDLGFSSDFVYTLLPIVILVFAILTIWILGRRKDEFGRKTFSLRRGLRGFFILFGLFLILLAIFTDIFYEKLTAIIIGAVLCLAGLLLLIKRRRRRTRYDGDYGPSPRGPGRRERRRRLKETRFGQRLGYEEEKARREYERKLGREGEKQRIKKLREMRRKRGEGYLTRAERQAYREKKRRGRERGGARAIEGGSSPAPRGEFQYSQGMRRGGLKPTRGRFVSRRAVERYARRFGAEAAKSRFG